MTPQDIRQLERELRHESGLTVMLELGPLDHTTSPYAAETGLMSRATAKRQREFYSGRHFARKAMERAGAAPCGLGRGDLGNPLWPAGYLGSITHGQHWAAAIAVKNDRIVGLGIDLLEHPEDVTSDLSDVIVSEAENAMLSQQFPTFPPTGLAFSLKESVVKAVSVSCGRFLELLEIRLTHSHGTLTAQVSGIPNAVHCRHYPTPLGLVTFSYFNQ